MKILKKKRIEQKLTQFELAQKLSVTQICVSNWERGKSHPRYDMLPRIAEALGCTVDELIKGE